MNDRRAELEKILFPGGNFPSKSWLTEKIILWADRWAGRPTREAIIQLYYDRSSSQGHFVHQYKSGVIADTILALYPTPSPERKRVSRENIVDTLNRHIGDGLPHTEKSLVVDDLCTLLGVEEEKPPFWCSHIEWNTCEDKPKWKMHKNGWILGDKLDDWDICPVAGCHAPRPVEKGRGEG